MTQMLNMLCTNRESGQFVDFPAQNVDPCFAQQSMDCLRKLVDPHFAQHRVRCRKLNEQDAIAERDCYQPHKEMLEIRI